MQIVSLMFNLCQPWSSLQNQCCAKSRIGNLWGRKHSLTENKFIFCKILTFSGSWCYAYAYAHFLGTKKITPEYENIYKIKNEQNSLNLTKNKSKQEFFFTLFLESSSLAFLLFLKSYIFVLYKLKWYCTPTLHVLFVDDRRQTRIVRSAQQLSKIQISQCWSMMLGVYYTYTLQSNTPK
jgi:hypothetical protein